MEALIKELEGKDISEVVAGGLSKLASVPSGGGGGIAAAAPAAGGGGGGGGGAAAKEEEKKKEESEEESGDDVRLHLLQTTTIICDDIVMDVRLVMLSLCWRTADSEWGLSGGYANLQDMGFSLFD